MKIAVNYSPLVISENRNLCGRTLRLLFGSITAFAQKTTLKEKTHE